MIKCKACGKELKEALPFCSNCGGKLEEEKLSTLRCPVCETKYSDEIKFCPQDGEELLPIHSTVPTCTKCKKEYPDGMKFCPEDGEPIALLPVHGTIKAQNKSGIHHSMSDVSNSESIYKKASIMNRISAFTIDFLIISIISIPAGAMYAYWLSDLGEAIHLYFYFILLAPVLWFGLRKEGFGKGQSPGKKERALMMVHLPSNKPCTKSKSAGRWIIFALMAFIPYLFIANEVIFFSLIIVAGLIDPILVISRTDGKRIADLLLGLQVINVDDFKETAKELKL